MCRDEVRVMTGDDGDELAEADGDGHENKSGADDRIDPMLMRE